MLQPARARWSTEVVVSAGVVILGVAIVAMSGLHRLSTLAPVMLIGGAAWITFISLISALDPESGAGLGTSPRAGGLHTGLSGKLRAWERGLGCGCPTSGCPDCSCLRRNWNHRHCGAGACSRNFLIRPSDLSPWNHWRMPVVVKEVGSELDRGPVLVTVEYVVAEDRRSSRRDPSIWAEYDFAMARTDGESTEIPRSRIVMSRYSWCIRGRNICASTSARRLRMDLWKSHARLHDRRAESASSDRRVFAGNIADEA